MNKTKIDWCDCTINPVVGCPRNCKYCYARIINNRFNKKYPKAFAKDFSKPEFKPERLTALKSKKPKSIFMDSMSDIEFWQDEWCDYVIKAIKQYPQHKYIFLTKKIALPYPLFYYHCFEQQKELEHQPIEMKTHDAIWGQNVFVGRTITGGVIGETTKCNFDFISIEPIQDFVYFQKHGVGGRIKQVIIGAETGNQKNKIIPSKLWIDNIVRECDERNIRVFMKESLRELMGKDFRQDKLIWRA